MYSKNFIEHAKMLSAFFQALRLYELRIAVRIRRQIVYILLLLSKPKTPAVFLISIAYQTIANRLLDCVRLCPDRLKAIVYQVDVIDYCFQAFRPNPIVYQQQSNRRLRSEIGPQKYKSNIQLLVQILLLICYIKIEGKYQAV